ncbi:M18 family aminopeptidase [Motiliproteus sp. SC1-56]|uniref:M18 family aminopeptidase n=1 Tax=Motiliproteus sp. SC1-56 TaxID=2799565 RepID=UPI001A8FB3F7|nr:M18 family aminopeptidase [Motiliproteus sp. SC1-56]
MDKTAFNRDLKTFLAASPTPFHAVASLAAALEGAGFEALKESDAWALKAGGRYYVTRNDSSLIAFSLPDTQTLVEKGLRLVGAHTDSPCLKLKPRPDLRRSGYYQLGVEVYGGALLNPWFDRDLSIAGRVHFLDSEGVLRQALMDFKDPVAVIPSLAIHLDREANNERSINPQKDLPLVLSLHPAGEDKPDFRHLLRERLQAQGEPVAEVLDYELFCYDVQPPAYVGLHQEFIASARLDNLLSCYLGLQALLEAAPGQGAILVCNDHEEVGSQSSSGADGPFLLQVLERLLPENEQRMRTLAASRMISADNAHGIHPNYADRHDANHGPLINGGPVIKINANQRYATNSESSAHFRALARQVQVPVQAFTVRSDMGCGSTIGPLTAAKLGVSTLDVGVPTFAMHSIRELAGSEDAYNLYRVLACFFSGQ